MFSNIQLLPLQVLFWGRSYQKKSCSLSYIIIQQRTTYIMYPFFISNPQNIKNYNQNPFISSFVQPFHYPCCHQNNNYFLNNQYIRVQCDHQGKGKWTKRQQLSYVSFLIENFNQMKEKTLRKSKKVFMKMSKMIKTRTPDQCRSHHQKVLHIYKSIQEIIRLLYNKKFQQKTSPKLSQSFKTQHMKTYEEQSQNKLYTLIRNQNSFRYQIAQSKISSYQ